MRGIHSKPNNGLSNDWITPKPIIDSLGGWESFALDPCCPSEMPWRTARAMLFVDRYDGLKSNWEGRTWLNPPYGSQLRKWISKLADHGDGIALVPSRTEVESWFWPYVWERADAVLFLRGRLYFHRPDGTSLGNAGHGSVLVAYGPANVESLVKSGIAGRLVELKRKDGE